MSQTPIKIGFVGVGSMGQCAHLRNYASASLSTECEVVAIAEIRPNLARETRAQGSFSFFFSDTNLVNFAETFFSSRDKTMRWMTLLTLAAFFIPRCSTITA